MIRLYDDTKSSVGLAEKPKIGLTFNTPQSEPKSPKIEPVKFEPIKGAGKFVLEKFPETTKGVAGLQTDLSGVKGFLDAWKSKTTMEKISDALGIGLVSNIADSIGSAVMSGAEKGAGFLSSLGVKDIKFKNILKGKSPFEMGTKPQTKAGIAGKALEAASGLASAGFSPISALFTEAAKIPIAGVPVKLINLGFGALGEGGSAIFNEALNRSVKNGQTSSEIAEKIRQGGSEIAALTAQIIGGGLAYKGSLEGSLKGTSLAGRKVPFLEGLKIEKPHPIIAEIVKETPEVKTQVEKISPKQVDSLTKKYGEQDTKTIIQVAAERATAEQANQGKIRLYPEEKIVGVSEEPQSRVFQRLKQEHPQLEGELGYDPIKLNEDAKKAVELVAKDKQKAYRVAMGAEASPDITSTATNIALAEKALSEGNNALYSNLIKNRSLAQTRRGQELVAEKGSVTDNSTARYVKELISLKLDKLGKNYLGDLKDIFKKKSDKQKAIDKIDKEIVKAKKIMETKKIDIKEAQRIIDSLACK